MNRVHRSIGFSAIDRYGSTLLLLLATMILARLLTPEEFGIYTAVSALMVLATVSSREFGGANYLIQKSSLSERDIRTAFTVNAGMSVLFAAALFGLRDAFAWFYSQPGLQIGIGVAALSFLLVPFSGTMTALLRREMAFDVIAACNLTANVVNAATAVALAALGHGFMSPLYGALAGQTVLMALLVGHRRRLRLFQPCLDGWREAVGFGASSSAVGIINVCYQMSPQLILGRVLDFTAVGLYGRAVNITQIFDRLVSEVLNPIIMPAVFAQTRAGADLKGLYLRAIELVTAVQWPFLIFTALMAAPIVSILLGPGWGETVPLVRMLCVASLCMFGAGLSFPVLVAAGRIHDALLASLISVPPSVLIVFAASFFGLKAVAAAAFVTLPLQVAVVLYFITRRLDIGAADLLGAMRKSAIVAAASALGVMAAVALNGFDLRVSMLGFVGAAVGALIGWWSGLVVTRHPLLFQIRKAAADLFAAMPPLRSLGSTTAPSHSRD